MLGEPDADPREGATRRESAGVASGAVGRRRRLGGLGAGVMLAALSLAPLFYLLLSGGHAAPLWMDEVVYHRYAEDWGTRESAPGVSVTLWEGALYSLFAWSNLLMLYLPALEVIGAEFWAYPELFLRLPSLLGLGLAAWLVCRRALAAGGWWADALLAAGALAALPQLQYYAFEAKAYTLAGAAAIAYLFAAARLVRRFELSAWIFATVLGGLLPYLSIWCAPLLGAAPAWALGAAWRRGELRSPEGMRRVASVALGALPGVAVAAIQVALLLGPFAYQTDMHFSQRMGLDLPGRLAGELWAAPSYAPEVPPEWLVLFGKVALGALLIACVVSLGSRRAAAVEPFLPFAFLVAFGGLLAAAWSVTGYIPGRYEVGVMALAVPAALGLPPSLRRPLLAAFLVIGVACLPWTRERILNKSNTRGLLRIVARLGEPRTEGVLTRPAYGWDPLHRYTAHFYLERFPTGWRARDYPSLEPLGRDFMFLETIARSPRSEALIARRDDPAVIDWVREERLQGLWVLTPTTEDGRPLGELLALEGMRLTGRWFAEGYPDTWLYRYRREEGGRVGASSSSGSESGSEGAAKTTVPRSYRAGT